MLRFLIFICSLWLWFFFSIVDAYGQGETCTNPILINPCPNVSFTSVSTAGMGNDINVTQYGYSMKGNDMVYKITPPAGNSNVMVSIKNISAPLYFFASYTPCPVPYYISTILYPGTSYDNTTYYATATSPLYITIDHNNATDITFDISFGSLGTAQYVTVPDTKGSWQAANSCISPITKSNMNVTWNGVQQRLPITLGPLSTQGTMCITPYLKNLTGNEGVKSVSFTFDPDLSNPSSTVTQMPGFYNAGTWNAVKSGSVITWTFTDAAGLGRGDFTGTPNNCLAYEFCFNFTPLSNNPLRTNIAILLKGDGYGQGYSYTTYGTGCCASNTGCLLGYRGPGSGGSGSGGSAIAMGLNDPPLPVELLSLEAIQKSNEVLVEWETASEFNNDRFEIERSIDGSTFESIGMVAGANRPTSYSFTDTDKLSGERYYRLKQVDVDGKITYSQMVSLQILDDGDVHVFPVPAQKTVTISSTLPISEYSIQDMYGNSVASETVGDAYSYEISIQTLPIGVYYISVKVQDNVIVKRFVKQ